MPETENPATPAAEVPVDIKADKKKKPPKRGDNPEEIAKLFGIRFFQYV